MLWGRGATNAGNPPIPGLAACPRRMTVSAPHAGRSEEEASRDPQRAGLNPHWDLAPLPAGRQGQKLSSGGACVPAPPRRTVVHGGAGGALFSPRPDLLDIVRANLSHTWPCRLSSESPGASSTCLPAPGRNAGVWGASPRAPGCPGVRGRCTFQEEAPCTCTAHSARGFASRGSACLAGGPSPTSVPCPRSWTNGFS